MADAAVVAAAAAEEVGPVPAAAGLVEPVGLHGAVELGGGVVALAPGLVPGPEELAIVREHAGPYQGPDPNFPAVAGPELVVAGHDSSGLE